MAIICETKNFILESSEKPEIDRLEGGHIKISPKVSTEDRTKLPPKQAIELMRLTIVSGEAMKTAMKKIGVEIGRINYQENGNWTPYLHIHLYGRARDAKIQKFGQPLISGHRPSYTPLNEDDIKRIQGELEKLFKLRKFSDSSWGLP
ncbi:MAG: HIT domain-containing protein [Candidatus Woesearchaeota archaeon]